VDLDLRVEAGEAKLGSSRGEKASEELIVPATKKGLAAIVDHYDGGAGALHPALRADPPGEEALPGKEADGQVSAETCATRSTSSRRRRRSSAPLSLSAPRAEGTDIDIHVYDDAWKEVAKSTGDACEEQVILSPSRGDRW